MTAAEKPLHQLIDLQQAKRKKRSIQHHLKPQIEALISTYSIFSIYLCL